MKTCVIGLDVGTTCAKALAVSETGEVLAQGSHGYPLIPDGAKVEQKSEDWIAAGAAAIRDAASSAGDVKITAISLSTQAGSTVALDERGDPIGNAWTWMDHRATAEAEAAADALGAEYIYKTTGWGADPSLDIAKIRRMKTMPEYAGAKKYLTTLEILNGYLTANAVIDPTNAALRQLFSVEEGDWDERILRYTGVGRDALPEIAPTGAFVGTLTAQAAADLRLSTDVAVYNGCHDQYCAALGAGAVQNGDMLLSAGTTWALTGITDAPLFTKSLIAPGRHPARGLYGAIASLVGSGASMQWFKDNFVPDDFRELDREAATRREKTRELFFYPYTTGASYPIWNLDMRGAFTGVGLEHDRFDFARAVMEGVCFGVRRALDDFAANGAKIRAITVLGGAAKSDVWMQILAAAANVPLRRLDQAEVCALGAAAIAACGAGCFSDYKSAADAMTRTLRVYEPTAEDVAYYAEKYHNYSKMLDCFSRYYAK